ncbi:beta strand repeat-containing protein [Flavobacterium capsici]|uniref:T9SS sorting signal type C domain-containing protein n=1 Tax=Flavobacterium capsici TaxID=3075618 RepID=A0AA96J6N0_9FLAO|nr:MULTISPECIES: T9SS sorting signal type C domain-containing protein [unclassified Flavobacterium]WNM19048.1 T9SS sorting signal type C domain-containing protein [Flavobacterium sp. PMR2A8]WNM23098.1 T9SS sorting signal type C domain-containing protein [Flavobacterium sp. PMTSA4]
MKRLLLSLFIKKNFFLILLFSLFFGLNFVNAQKTASTGNWNTPATWSPSGVPVAGDNIIIPNGITVTLNTSFNSSNLITIVGTGKIKFTRGNTLTIDGTIDFQGTSANQIEWAGNENTGNQSTVNVNGTLKTANSSGITSVANSSIQTNGNNQNINLNTTANYEFNGVSQTMTGLPTSVNNLILSGSGTKTFPSTLTVSNNLSISNGVIANLGTFTHSAGTLTLNGAGTPSGSHGSTSSTATYKNNTFFAATSGLINVTTCSANNIAGAASSTPTLCINTALTPITHTTTWATGIGSALNLPTGVTASWSNNTITISGTPTSSGPFSYSIPLTGGCGSAVNATGSINVTPDNTVGTASSTPTLCINTALTPITRTTTGATGIGTPTGLPSGVTASWASNTITISGTPTASGTFNYSIPLTGGCGNTSATGTIIVTPNNTAGTPSSTPTLCINTALTPITRTTTGATGIGTPTNLPSGVTASWASNTITISGTPTNSGTFNYSIPLTGGCGSVNATGTITVTPNKTVSAPSSTPTLCINTALTAITHTTTGATGYGLPSGLPLGVTVSFASNTLTISGTPTASGTFNYSIPITGGCGSGINATGIITVSPNNTVGAPSSTPTLCINTSLTAITHSTTGATGIGSPTGLPSGVTASWASNTITISGTPTASGTFNYTIPLTGGCGSVNATGTITVSSNNTVSAPSSTPTVTINTALTPITHTTTGATGIGSATGLPSGVTASWASNTITISGTPTASGTFNYNIPLTGGCGSVNATGTITVMASGGSVTWIGAVDTDWLNAANWSGGVPNSASNVIIGTASFYPQISSDVTINTLTIDASSSLLVNSLYNLTVTDAIVNNGTLTIENNANLIQVNNVANTGSGSTVVKRESNPLIRLDYTAWSSPVSGQGLLDFSPLTAISPSVRFYTYNTSTNLYSSISSGAISTEQFSIGKGYLIRVPFNHPTAPAIWNGAFTGNPHNGDYNVAVSDAGTPANPPTFPVDRYGYNLIGNPYPSPISISQFASDNSANIETTFYFWRKTNNASSPSYCTWNSASNTFGDNGELYTETPNNVIQTGQGFIIQAKTGVTSVQFNNGQRVANNANQFFRNSNDSALSTPSTIESNRIWLNLTGDSGTYSQTVVGYFTNATDGVDDFDSKYFNDGPVALTTVINNQDYVIQGRSLPFSVADVVPLKYKVTNSGNYTISIDHVDGMFDNNQIVYLRDNTNNIIHNLSSGNYVFASEAGTFVNRFDLVYQTQLSTDTNTFTENQILILNDNSNLIIQSNGDFINDISVFDLRGRLITSKNRINNSISTIPLNVKNQVVLVKVTSINGVIVNKKVMR